MKYFAITPDDCSIDYLASKIPHLKEKGVWGLYLRSGDLKNRVAGAAKITAEAGIIPIVYNADYSCCRAELERFKAGVHFKSSEYSRSLRDRFTGSCICTVSAHSTQEAERLLTEKVDYVFLSPVFKPFSKNQASPRLLPLNDIKMLVAVYSEKVVLLGGMTIQRIGMIRKDIKDDFSVAGITMFFE